MDEPQHSNNQENIYKDKPRQYVRQQKGHSILKHLIFGGFVLWIPTVYYTVSPNHYWHL